MSHPSQHEPRADEAVPADAVPAQPRGEGVAAQRRIPFEAEILAAIADAVVVTDVDERITFWNPGAERIFRVQAADALGGSIEVMFPAGRAAGVEGLHAAMAASTMWEGDILLRTDDGGERVIEVVSYPFSREEPDPARVSLIWDVTGQRAAAGAADRLAALVEQAEDAIYLVGPDGLVLTWNGGAERLTGISAEQAIGAPCPVFGNDDAVEAVRRLVFEGRQAPYSGQGELRTADGTTVTVSLSASPVRGADGRIVAVSVVARDERARIAADAELRFRDAILTAVDDAVVATDMEGRVVFWSPGAERLFAVGAPDALGRALGDVSPVELIGITADAARAALSADGTIRFDAIYTRPDGSTFVGETHANLAQRPQGATVRMAVVRDVTEIRRSAADSARLAAIVQDAGDMIIGTDLDAVVQSWNPAAERALGYAAGDMIGRTIAVYIAPEHLPLAFDLRHRLTDGGAASAAAELTYVTRDGDEFPAWEVISPVRDAGGTVIGISAIGHDLRQHKSLEAQLRQAQKLEAVGRLAGGIAHDFNNLLTAVTGYASLVLAGLPPDGVPSDDMRQILGAADRAAGLTRSLLAFSRGKPRVPRVVALDEVVARVGPMIRRLLPEAVELVLDADANVAVLADPTELDLVLVNLAVNGADAMPHGGTLTIRVRAVALDAAFAQGHLGVAPGPHAEILVVDTGAGMTEEVRSHLFEPFFTTKPDGAGAGLGLTTVHASVEAAGGTIWVDSVRGRGTTFRILLPVSEEQPLPAPALGLTPATGGSERIALVEDDAAVRGLATTVLRRAGYALAVFADPREAADLDPSTIDLLLSDVVMPHLDGPALAGRLRSIRPDLPVLFMSGYTDRADTADFAAHSARPLLAKPFGPADLLDAVRGALDDATQAGDEAG